MDDMGIGYSLVNLSIRRMTSMPKKKYRVTLSDNEREQLEHLLPSGTHASRQVTRARMLLKAAEGWQESALAAALAVGRATVARLRPRFVAEGLGALEERPRPGTQPKLDAKAEARLIAATCRAAPAGRQRWPLHLLADRVVALGLAPSYSAESVRRVLNGPQAVAEEAMVHPSGACGVRRPHGRRPGGLRRAV
jgi:transposase